MGKRPLGKRHQLLCGLLLLRPVPQRPSPEVRIGRQRCAPRVSFRNAWVTPSSRGSGTVASHTPIERISAYATGILSAMLSNDG